ncbi:hypothetical protein MKQ68_24225 [Chitinophaga horti]|uniref:Lipoprotein n=1 Tax=Chitinophaga horti TaxID=2920382 RepID=A0ABY6J0W7_9BACT|nr:hypothetical protein [Chitinophaga horti]UYQ93193.1 hypothetical protein MKQ68_24225 [Chitinophaga horti]
MMKHYFNTNKVLALGVLAVTSVSIFFACKKDDKVADNKEETKTLAAAEVNAAVGALYEDAFNVTVNASASEDNLNKNQGRIAAGGQYKTGTICPGMGISVSPIEFGIWPKTVTIDFGTGCTVGQRTRKGKIVIEISKILFTSGAIAKLTFENYSVNGIKVEGTQLITNTSSNMGFSFTYTVTGGKATYPDNSVYTYVTNRTIAQTEGSETLLDLGDDAYGLSGTATVSYTDSTNAVTTANFNTKATLIKKADCPYVAEGILEIALNNIKGTIDYGKKETCDNKATLTVGDKSKEITLP